MALYLIDLCNFSVNPIFTRFELFLIVPSSEQEATVGSIALRGPEVSLVELPVILAIVILASPGQALGRVEVVPWELVSDDLLDFVEVGTRHLWRSRIDRHHLELHPASELLRAVVQDLVVVVVSVKDVEVGSLVAAAHGGLAGPGAGGALVALIQRATDAHVAELQLPVASEVQVHLPLFLVPWREFLGDAAGTEGPRVLVVSHRLVPLATESGRIEVGHLIDLRALAKGVSTLSGSGKGGKGSDSSVKFAHL